jgi:hypothetical protein
MSIRNVVQAAARNTTSPALAKRLAIASLLPALALAGCVAVPAGQAPDGTAQWAYYPVGTVVPAPHAAAPGVPVPQGTAAPRVLNVRLYPANDIANHTGLLTGTVTNMMTGRGRFQFQFQGELLAGEATRVSGEERKGIASAYGPSGTYASCEYQMNSPVQGAGTCQFSNGARYQIHIGS